MLTSSWLHYSFFSKHLLCYLLGLGGEGLLHLRRPTTGPPFQFFTLYAVNYSSIKVALQLILL